jgi:fatty-acyl-CoA synthase
MQDRPLLISSLIEHAAKFHPTTEVVTRQADGSYDRANWLRDPQRGEAGGSSSRDTGLEAGRPGRDPGLEHPAPS